MTYIIKIVDNNFYIQDTSGVEQDWKTPSKSVRYEEYYTEGKIIFFDVDKINHKRLILFSEMVDNNNNAFSSFQALIDFLDANTGKSNASTGGTTESTLPTTVSTYAEIDQQGLFWLDTVDGINKIGLYIRAEDGTITYYGTEETPIAFLSNADALATLGANKKFLYLHNNSDDIVSTLDNVSAYTVQTYNFDITANWNLTLDNNGNLSPVTNETEFIQWLTNGVDGDGNSKDLTGISVLNFDLANGRLKCNLTVTGGEYFYMAALEVSDIKNITLPSSLTELSLYGNQLTTFNPTLPLPNNLTYLSLYDNQLTTFNPTLPLPNNLTYLPLDGNQLTTFNPTLPLPGSLTELSLYGNQLITFNPTLPLPGSLTDLYLNYNQLTTSSYTQMEQWANVQPSFTNPCNIYFSNNIDSITGTNLEAILLTKNCVIHA